MKTMTLDQAAYYLYKAMETQGRNFVYRPVSMDEAFLCVYRPLEVGEFEAKEGDPRLTTGCLVGVALGLAEKEMEWGHGWYNAQCAITGLPTYPNSGVRIAADALQYLRVAQTAQDRGLTWGEAYDRAEAWRDGYLYALMNCRPTAA